MGWWSDVTNVLGDIAPIAGTVLGGVFGGPAGAAIGGAIGGGLSGYQKTGHLGGTLEGAALGGAGGALAGWATPLGAAAGSAGSSSAVDALGLLGGTGGATVSQSALGLGTNLAPGYILPSTGSSLLGDLASGAGSSALSGLGKLYGGGNLIGGLAQLYGAHVAQGNANALQQLVNQTNAFGPYRAGAAAQLNNLLQNPSSVTSLPGYQAGIEAINRDAAAKGYFGSGNQEGALALYGNQVYNQQLGQLANLSGATFNPASLIGGLNSAGQSAMSGLGLLSGGLSSFMK